MKRTIATLTAVLILAGCGSPGEGEQRTIDDANNNTFEVQQRMNNGDIVRCVVFSQAYRGGISCDWENPF